MSKFDVDDIGTDALLFQTGYLTIVGETWDGVEKLYTLDYPNFEVRRSLNQGLLEYMTRRRRGKPIHLVGMVFGRKERNLLGIRHERG